MDNCDNSLGIKSIGLGNEHHVKGKRERGDKDDT